MSWTTSSADFLVEVGYLPRASSKKPRYSAKSRRLFASLFCSQSFSELQRIVHDSCRSTDRDQRSDVQAARDQSHPEPSTAAVVLGVPIAAIDARKPHQLRQPNARAKLQEASANSLCAAIDFVPKRTPAFFRAFSQPHQVARFQSPIRGAQHTRARHVIRRALQSSRIHAEAGPQPECSTKSRTCVITNGILSLAAAPPASRSPVRCASDRALRNSPRASRGRVAARFLRHPVPLPPRTRQNSVPLEFFAIQILREELFWPAESGDCSFCAITSPPTRRIRCVDR